MAHMFVDRAAGFTLLGVGSSESNRTEKAVRRGAQSWQGDTDTR